MVDDLEKSLSLKLAAKIKALLTDGAGRSKAL